MLQKSQKVVCFTLVDYSVLCDFRNDPYWVSVMNLWLSGLSSFSVYVSGCGPCWPVIVCPVNCNEVGYTLVSVLCLEIPSTGDESGFCFCQNCQGVPVCGWSHDMFLWIVHHLNFYYYLRPSLTRTRILFCLQAMASLTTVQHTNGAMPNEHSLHFHSQCSSFYQKSHQTDVNIHHSGWHHTPKCIMHACCCHVVVFSYYCVYLHVDGFCVGIYYLWFWALMFIAYMCVYMCDNESRSVSDRTFLSCKEDTGIYICVHTCASWYVCVLEYLFVHLNLDVGVIKLWNRGGTH